MKNKKSLVAIIGVLLVAVVGATIAYFSSNTTYDNAFDVGDYNVVTKEVFTAPTDWSPGETIEKTITSKNEGTIDAVVRIRIYPEIIYEGEEYPHASYDFVDVNFNQSSDWGGNGSSYNGYYYYYKALGAGEETSSLIDSLTLKASLNNVECREDENGAKVCKSLYDWNNLDKATYIFNITVETCPYDKYKEVWGTSVYIDRNHNQYTYPLSSSDKQKLITGDEICVEGTTTECFNFVRYDGNDAVLLTKYGLKVGNIYGYDENDDYVKLGEYTSNDSGYGLQYELIGEKHVGNNYYYYGTVPFSIVNYWEDENGLKAKYGEDYPVDVYDTDYNAASGDNYSVAYYVNMYKNTLINNYNLNVKSARLITYDELHSDELYCSGNNCSSSFLARTCSYYWTGSADDDDDIYYVDDEVNVNDTSYDYDDYISVRPVIVISKDNL